MKAKFLFYLVCLLSWVSCAQFATPQGGPKDSVPPEIVPELSEQNFQTNFSKQSFELVFNEWIQLKNPVKEIVISPPTSYPLQYTVRGKAVKVEFAEDESLKPDATYQINFGDALRDFTESNIYKNLVFVFSTGDEIDSLSIAGSVIDVETGKPAKDVIVSLYDTLNDSIITQEKPFYFTKTDNSGRYKLSNIKSDSFLIFTLKDENVNYFYDLGKEKVGFYKEVIALRDSNLINIDLELFDEADQPRLVEYKQSRKGLIKLYINPVPDSLEFNYLGEEPVYVFHELVGDSVYLWHDDLNSDSTAFTVLYDGKLDTIQNRKATASAKSIPVRLDASVKRTINVHKGDTVMIAMNKPLKDIDNSRISLSDTSRTVNFTHISTRGKNVILLPDSLEHNKTYQLKIDSSGVFDIYGKSNKDSISVSIKTYDPANLGTLALSFVNETDSVYLWQLNKANNLLYSGAIESTETRSFERMGPGKYTLTLIEDLNRDGKWTSGNVLLKRKPERIKEISLEELKPGWDLELDIVIKEIFYGAEG